MQGQGNAVMFRPPRLNAAGVCYWCASRWCDRSECVAAHEASLWLVCPVCWGGIDPAEMDGPIDWELLSALKMTTLIGPDGEMGNCYLYGCHGGVVEAPSAAVAELVAARFLPAGSAAVVRLLAVAA